MLNMPLEKKTGHFRDVLPRHASIMVLEKLNLTQQNQTCTTTPKHTAT